MTEEKEGGVVQKETCKALREGCTKAISGLERDIDAVEEVSTKRLDAHATDIKALERVSMELAGTAAALTRLLEAQDGRLKSLEDARLKQLEADAEAAKAAASKKKPWYETNIGQWVIKGAVVTAVVVLAVAIGKPFLETIESLGGMPN